MTLLNPESLSWVDQLETIRALGPNASRADRKKALNLSDGLVTAIINLEACFDPAAIEKVRQASSSQQTGTSKADPPYILSSGSAKALIGLKKRKVADLHGKVHAALDVIFTRRLDTRHIKALVEWMLKGNSADTFNESETGKKTKTDKGSTKDKNQKILDEPPSGDKPDDLTAQIMELAHKANEEKARGDGQTTYQDELKALLEKRTDETLEDEDSGKKGKAGKKSKSQSGADPSLLWESMVGIKYITQLRKKAKKGELTNTDKVLIVIDNIYKAFKWVGKRLWKHLLEPLFKAVGHWFKETFGKAFSLIMKWAIPLLIIAAFIWGAGKVYQLAIVNPLHWLERKVVSGLHGGGSENSPTTVPISQSAASVAPVKEIAAAHRKKEKPKPVITYQPAVSFIPNPSSSKTLYDPKLLDQEIAAIPSNSIIKDYVFQPDEGMPADLAVSRLQDLTDEDKYTMMIGSGKQKILSVTPSNTNFILVYKSTDPFGLFGNSSGTMNIFLEDVKYIHVNEIDRVYFKSGVQQADIKYQCTVVAKGAKNPLTIQCDSTDDLQNLVSTLEYFIRHSRLAHDAQPGGMPYPSQGIVLNNDCLVNKLWANSPMDKAGVGLGEMIWSVDKNAPLPPERKKLETQLGALTAGHHDLFIVSQSDRDKARVQMNADHSNNFNPQRHKAVLTAF